VRRRPRNLHLPAPDCEHILIAHFLAGSAQ
jgi:hypothetical protein